jgi:hypothetical protein
MYRLVAGRGGMLAALQAHAALALRSLVALPRIGRLPAAASLLMLLTKKRQASLGGAT